MKQFTIRGIPEEIERVIKNEAEIKGLSLNKAFISVLKRATGKGTKVQKDNPIYHDLDHLCGVLSEEEGEELINNINLQRKIDKELWKETE